MSLATIAHSIFMEPDRIPRGNEGTYGGEIGLKSMPPDIRPVRWAVVGRLIEAAALNSAKTVSNVLDKAGEVELSDLYGARHATSDEMSMAVSLLYRDRPSKYTPGGDWVNGTHRTRALWEETCTFIPIECARLDVILDMSTYILEHGHDSHIAGVLRIALEELPEVLEDLTDAERNLSTPLVSEVTALLGFSPDQAIDRYSQYFRASAE